MAKTTNGPKAGMSKGECERATYNLSTSHIAPSFCLSLSALIKCSICSYKSQLVDALGNTRRLKIADTENVS